MVAPDNVTHYGERDKSHDMISTFVTCVLFALCSECDNVSTTHYYLSSDRLQEVENKAESQTFCSKSGRGRSREVPTIVI